MTTPSTADLRAWARENGLTVADRGRIASDVLNAWQSAQTPARRKRRLTPRPDTSGPSAAPEASQRASADQDLQGSASVAQQLAALTERVQRLEKSLAGKPEKERKKQKK